MSNKYLVKIAGMPITRANLKHVAETVTKGGIDFAEKAKGGMDNVPKKDLMSFGNRTMRLNKNMPKELHEEFEGHQMNWLKSKGFI